MEAIEAKPQRKHRRRRSEILPELAPPPETGWWRRTTGPEGTRIEAGSAPARRMSAKAMLLSRIGVGCMAGMLFFAAHPVGAGVLALNTLGGPDLRTTAQVAALTGLYVPLIG